MATSVTPHSPSSESAFLPQISHADRNWPARITPRHGSHERLRRCLTLDASAVNSITSITYIYKLS